MIRRLTATVLSLLVLCAATISLNDEIAPAELFSAFSAEQLDEAFIVSEAADRPDYPDAVSQRLLRKRVSPRALISVRIGNAISVYSYCDLLQSCSSRPASPRALYQHQTSLRI